MKVASFLHTGQSVTIRMGSSPLNVYHIRRPRATGCGMVYHMVGTGMQRRLVAIRALRANLKRFLADLTGGPLYVTHYGKVIAVVREPTEKEREVKA